MPIQVSRRQLMASAGGMVLASFALPSGLRKILDRASPARPAFARATAPISEIKHVVVLMQENRSFDHYFGAMPGVRGFSDPNAITLSSGKSVFYQPIPATAATAIRGGHNPDGYLLPFHADTHSTSAQRLPSTSHYWGPQHSSYAGGAMDGFVSAHLKADGVAGEYSMAYFTRDDIPFHWALADAFTICDGYHCSVLGPTLPNRLYLMTGQIDPEGKRGGPIYAGRVPAKGLSWLTYPELLTRAGVSWKVYQEAGGNGYNVLKNFDQYQNAPQRSPLYQSGMRFHQPGQFEYDASHDRLPAVSWIIPPPDLSEHPDFMPAAGADYISRQVDAIASNPDVFAATVFILVYDENDGYFDHVVPPTAPAGTPGEYITASAYSRRHAPGAIGLGFRVPCVIVSPWTVGGFVCHDTFDHTSVIRLLELVTGVHNPGISAWRRQAVGDLTTALGAVPDRRFPRLPPTAAQLQAAEREVARFRLPPYPGARQPFPAVPPGSKPVRSAAS